jgi:hypothetical protein
MEGQPGQVCRPNGDAVDVGFNKSLPSKFDPAAAKNAAGRCRGFIERPKSGFFTKTNRLPGDTQSGIYQLKCWRLSVLMPPQCTTRRGILPAHFTRGEFSMSMSGWGTLTGEAHYTLSSLAHSNDRRWARSVILNNPRWTGSCKAAAIRDERYQSAGPRRRQRAGR